MTDWASEAVQIETGATAKTDWSAIASQIESGQPQEQAGQQPQQQAIDTSRLEKNKELRPIADIVRDKLGMNVRQPGYSMKELSQSAADKVTGSQSREFNLPEFDVRQLRGNDRDIGGELKAFIGDISTMDPENQIKAYVHNFPDLKVGQDKFGNAMIDASAYGGDVTYFNRPGLSSRDITSLVIPAAEFTPASLSGMGAKTMTRGMGRVAAATGGTETGLTAANLATTGRNVEPADIGNVALATVAGGGFEGMGTLLAGIFSKGYSQTGKITNGMREAFRESAKTAGIDPAKMTDDVILGYLKDAQKATGGQGEGEFGIRYTEGQRSGKPGQLMAEDTLRNGPSGGAREKMAEFDAATESGHHVERVERIAGGITAERL